MTPLQFLIAIRSRYRMVLLVMMATIAVALFVTVRLPIRYTASSSVMVDIRASDPLTAMIMPNNLQTQVDIIQSDRVAQKVIKRLKLDQGPEVHEQWSEATNGNGALVDWLVERMKKETRFVPSRDSNIITITSIAHGGGASERLRAGLH
jgi:protein tyrosine kinase modulator